MIPALIMAIIGLLLGGDSPYLIPNMNKYVKKYVVEKEQKKQILLVLKDAKNNHKSFVKKDKKTTKQINLMFQTKETKRTDFDPYLKKMNDSRAIVQEQKRKLILETQKSISQDEWLNIKNACLKDIKKLDKKLTKNISKLEKAFAKNINKINKTIQNEAKRNEAIKGVEAFEKLFFTSIKKVKNNITNTEANIYQYNVSENEISTFQDNLNSELNEIMLAYIDMHFVLSANTNEKEWKKIRGNVKIPF